MDLMSLITVIVMTLLSDVGYNAKGLKHVKFTEHNAARFSRSIHTFRLLLYAQITLVMSVISLVWAHVRTSCSAVTHQWR